RGGLGCGAEDQSDEASGAGAHQERSQALHPEFGRCAACEVVEDGTHDPAREQRKEVEQDAGGERTEKVEIGPVTDQPPDELPGAHARASSRPARSRRAKREAGSRARMSRGPYSSTRPPSRTRMSSARRTVPS